MTANEAFDFGLSKIKELQKETGIKIKFRQYDFTTEHGKEVKEEDKFKTEKHASHEKWCRITFCSPFTDEESEKIRELGNYLNMVGMSWDSGGCATGRDWEWDWSFKYVGKDNQEAREARDQLEDLFDECNI